MFSKIREAPFTAWEALSIAAGIEQRGIRFYRAALAECTDAAAQRVYEEMVGEEHRHLAILESAMYAARGLAPEASEVVRSYLDELDDELTPFPQLPRDEDGSHALASAQRVERVAARNYLQLARASVDLRAKAVLVALAGEEMDHNARLANALGDGTPAPSLPEADVDVVTRLSVVEEELRRAAPKLSEAARSTRLEEPLPTDDGSVYDQLAGLRRLVDRAEEDLDALLDNRIVAMEALLQGMNGNRPAIA
jgi:rubrerythrin